VTAPDAVSGWDELCAGLPSHDGEMSTAHAGRPTDAAAVSAGVTAASGEGHGPGTGIRDGV
jgi:hypothetical protein